MKLGLVVGLSAIIAVNSQEINLFATPVIVQDQYGNQQYGLVTNPYQGYTNKLDINQNVKNAGDNNILGLTSVSKQNNIVDETEKEKVGTNQINTQINNDDQQVKGNKLPQWLKARVDKLITKQKQDSDESNNQKDSDKINNKKLKNIGNNYKSNGRKQSSEKCHENICNQRCSGELHKSSCQKRSHSCQEQSCHKKLASRGMYSCQGKQCNKKHSYYKRSQSCKGNLYGRQSHHHRKHSCKGLQCGQRFSCQAKDSICQGHSCRKGEQYGRKNSYIRQSCGLNRYYPTYQWNRYHWNPTQNWATNQWSFAPYYGFTNYQGQKDFIPKQKVSSYSKKDNVGSDWRSHQYHPFTQALLQ